MQGRLFNILTGVSCGAFLLLGIVNILQDAPVSLGSIGRGRGFQVSHLAGAIRVTWASPHPRVDGPRYNGVVAHSHLAWIADKDDAWTIPHVPQQRVSFLGVQYERGALVFLESHQYATSAVARRFALPSLHLMLVSLVLPSFFLLRVMRKWRAQDRSKSGKCPICGYDLRATPDCCPECGAIPSHGGAAAA
jgi:hypothetical protein